MAKITIHRIFLPFNQMAARISSFSLFFVHIFPHFLFLSSKFVFFREIPKQKSEIDTRDDSRVMKPRLGFLISFFFFFPDSKRRNGKERIWNSNRDRQLSRERDHFSMKRAASGNCCTNSWTKIQQRTGGGWSVCVASEPVSFFSSSTQTKLFYLTSRLPFAFRDFSLTEQCSQPLTLVVLVRGHLTLSPCNYVYTVYTYGSRFFAFP